MATREDCIRVATGNGLSAEDAALLVDEIGQERDRLTASGQTADMTAAIARRIMDKAEAARMKARAERRMAALNIVTHDRIQTFANSVKAEGGDVVDALEALMVGSGKRFTGGRESVSRLGSSLKALWGGSMANELDKAGVLPLLKKDRDFSHAVMREMIQPDSTGDALARQTADIFSRYLEDMRQKLNKAGADIGKLDNYAPQSHDSLRLRRAGETEWLKFVSERLDWERTFPEQGSKEARTGALGEVYQTIISGKRRETTGEKVRTSAFTPPRNLATSLGNERTLHFKDATGAVEYNQRFGTGNVVHAVIGQMEAYSRRLALMQTFGPNPEVMIRGFLDREAEALRNAHDDPARALDAWRDDKRGKLGHYYRALSGEMGTPENPTVARIAAASRAVMSMSKLGSALLSSFADIAIKTQAAIHAGEGWLPAWRSGIEMRFERFQSNERRELGRSLGVYTQGLLGELYSKFDVNDALSGTMTRWMNTFFKMSGLTGWTEAHRAAYTYHLSNRLARQALAGGAEGIDADFAAVLGKNGLLDRWNLIGKLVDEVEGEQYVIPENAYRLTEADLEAHLPEHLREGSAPAGLPEGVSSEELVAVVAVEPKFSGLNANVLRKRFPTEIKEAVLSEFNSKDGVCNEHTGKRIGMSSNDFNEHMKFGESDAVSGLLQLEAVAALPELTRKAKLVETYADHKNTSSIRQMHRLQAALRIGDKDYAVKLTVKEFKDGALRIDAASPLKLYHHRLEKEMPAGTFPALSQRNQPPRPSAGMKSAESSANVAFYSLRQLLSRVKNSEGKPFFVGEGDLRQWQAARTAEFERMREKLAQDVMGYFADETGYAVLEPDAKTRAAMYRGTKPGSLTGEMLRFAWQFKAFPVTFWQRTMAEGHWQRASRQPVGGFSSWHERFTGDIPAFIHFALATTALGYVSMLAKELGRDLGKDLGKGKKGDTTVNPVETTLAAFMQGGGIGLLGDYFLGAADRLGNHLTINTATSVPPDLRNLGVITGQAARGNLGAAGETAVRNATNTLSYANLWQTRSGMDYLLHSHLHEMMGPGALARSERKMKDALATHQGVQYQLPAALTAGGIGR